MKDFLEWVRSRFQHPLILILFVFGAVLLLMGIGQELPWSDKSALVADEPFERYGSLAIGSIFVVLAVVMMYRPPKGWVRSRLESRDGADDEAGAGPSLGTSGRPAGAGPVSCPARRPVPDAEAAARLYRGRTQRGSGRHQARIGYHQRRRTLLPSGTASASRLHRQREDRAR